MQIELRMIENNKPVVKTFDTGFIAMRLVKDAISLQDVLGKGEITTEMVDQLAAFVVKVYNNKFSIDELYDGLEIDAFLPTLVGTVQQIADRMMGKIENISDVGPVESGDNKKK